MKRQTGEYEKLGTLNYFTPYSLPPENPPLQLNGDITFLYGQAMHRIGQLNEMALRIPNAQRFLKAYIIKEALLSSAIEGIHTTLIDAFTSPLISQKPSKDTQLVLNYTKALDVALECMQLENLPIVNRVILAAHEALMQHGEGEKADPGNYRKQSVRVGNLVPPQAHRVPQLMADLEQFINTDESLPPLIKAGLAHVQFETIHPFLDGNGRIGRLLIILMLVDSKLLSTPILYPSYYFKKHHQEYYHRLDGVRLNGDFEGWISFYLRGIEASSFDAYQRALAIEAFEKQLKKIISNHGSLSKKIDDAQKALAFLFQSPIITTQTLADAIDKSYNTTAQLIATLVELKILRESEHQKRNKLFYFDAYIELLEKEYPE